MNGVNWRLCCVFYSALAAQIAQCWQHVTLLLPHLPVPTQGLRGLTEQQMKSTHVIYRQRFLLKNNCGDHGWAQGSMAMDFSVVGSCIVGHNERWKGGRRGGEEGRSGRGTAAVFLIGRKCLTRSSVTILEVRDTWIKNTFCLHQRVQHEHRIICQSLNRLFCMAYFSSCVFVSALH